jgi:hypothetical protein
VLKVCKSTSPGEIARAEPTLLVVRDIGHTQISELYGVLCQIGSSHRSALALAQLCDLLNLFLVVFPHARHEARHIYPLTPTDPDS